MWYLFLFWDVIYLATWTTWHFSHILNNTFGLKVNIVLFFGLKLKYFF